ncbi:MAG: metallopeptidase family protein [Propionibacterium sp.]|nr:metallopeptidase family protein [Propionibacterium sp.]
MPRRRDRHDRGFRGPIAAPDSPVKLRRRTSRTDFFNQCLGDAIRDVLEREPDALDGIVVGVEEVPHLAERWSGDRVPLSAALEASKSQQARIVLYERPIEHRAQTPSDLQRLVHRTLVEQLSTLTGRSVDSLGGEDWDEL